MLRSLQAFLKRQLSLVGQEYFSFPIKTEKMFDREAKTYKFNESISDIDYIIFCQFWRKDTRL